MSGSPINSSFYKVGGALPQDVPSYVTRESDTDLYEALKAGEFCYVLNSRQMGKTSLMVRTLAKLQDAGWKGIIIDFSAKDSQVDKPGQWYDGIINQLNRRFGLLDRQAFRSWLKERDFIAPVERLAEFIDTVLLPGTEESIVVFIDEIDSTLSLPFTDDFFALIRGCYNKRAENSAYQKLTFALLGVAAPSELIGDAKRTPFNVGKSIDLKGFTSEEALPLAAGLQGKAEQPEVVLQEILRWTGGQPFLTQRLCQLVVDSDEGVAAGGEAVAIDGLVNTRLIDSWETQDHQEHLKTIRQRLLDDERKAGYLLELYRQIRQVEGISASNQPEERELQLSGLVVKRDSRLRVYNPIYRAVFDETWIDGELRKLRPYAESFRAWVGAGKGDSSRLLRGGALTEAEGWAAEKVTLSAEDREFLAASRAQQREEDIAAREQEAELERERTAREAAEAAEQIQVEATREAQRKVRRGGLVLAGALVSALVLGGLAVFSGKQWSVAEQKREEAEILAEEANDELTEIQAQKEQADEQRKQAQQKAKTAQAESEQANKDLEESQEQLETLDSERQEANERLKQAQQEAQGQEALLSQLKQDLTNADAAVAQAEQAEEVAQRKADKAARDLEIARQEQQEIAALNETTKALSGLIDDLYAIDKSEAAEDVIQQIGLSFTDFTEDRNEFKKTLLNSSIALARLHLDTSDLEEASQAVAISIETIENNQSLFSSSSAGQSIAFFAYAVQGNFLEERSPDIFPDAAYRRAFKIAGYSTLNEKKLTSLYHDLIRMHDIAAVKPSIVGDGILLHSNLPTLVKSSLKKHYKFRVTKLTQSLESVLVERDWEKADLLTWEAIYSSASSRDIDSFRYQNISCTDLENIDSLWLDHSKINETSHFGFNVRNDIHKQIQSAIGNQTFFSISMLLNEVGWLLGDFSVDRSINARLPVTLPRNTNFENIVLSFSNLEVLRFKEYESLVLSENHSLNSYKRGSMPALAVNEHFRGSLYDIPMSSYGEEFVVINHCGYFFFAATSISTSTVRGL
ncbi:AAA-like domain-containing protein [Leptothoe spongobia]|uniref:AAA-like domain-containing protein n=1 Tax=Leptothoe spongobia TAU-MAC 1115 TaxID=1967444 RepID=A0A947DH50_9CYAN|nr:AAA-like domain-containing protein [Leptothoe spongobia]MBT9316518.1 AAA-like domain-containing protein [Leptothoe spongobia TAU-MAC 1115]